MAPSPTGAQHLGNARTYLLAWLSIRSQRGTILLRIEDLDSPRTKSWATQQAIEDLGWLGLDWDNASLAWVQSQRLNRYREVFELLQQRQLVYPCTCTRKEVESAASAPHESTPDAAVYPGTCRNASIEYAQLLDERRTNYCWRFRLSDAIALWNDAFCGPQSKRPRSDLGDFVLARVEHRDPNSGELRPSGPVWSPAYQLAVVVDDHDMGITEVLRGDDLIASTFRQIAIYDALDWAVPRWIHTPLLVGPDGRRLAKRHGDTRLSTYRQRGIRPEQIVGYLAYRSGLMGTPQDILPVDLISTFDLSRLPREKCVIPDDAFPTNP
jgi:glutamyl-tRNA synthetase